MTTKESYIRRQASKLTAGQINRRRFIMSALATGVTLPTALSLASRAQAQTPKAGGLFRLASSYGSTTDILDPSTAENAFTQMLIHSRGNMLTEVSNTGELIGELAESYEPSNGAKTWVFNLRSGVEFHDGKTLTADDVIASLNYHRGENTKSAAKGLVASVTDIKKDGDNRVIVELESGNADFPMIVSDYHLMIMPSENGELVDPNGMNGTGGYVLNAYDPGVRAQFTRNPNYWKEGRAHFDEVEMLSILDTTARQNAIMNGEVDYADTIDPKTVALLGRVPTLTILETTGTQHFTFPMRLDVEPFGNYDLRMALKYAINRQELVDKILLGHGVAGNDVPVNGSMPFFNTELPVHEFDAEKAAEHYKKSGHSGPIQLSVSDAAFAGAVDAAQLMAASAGQAGIQIEVVREPSDGYWSNVWNKKGWCACYWGGRPTQDWMYSSAYVADTEWNDTAWKGTEAADKFNDLVVSARSETDDAKRKDQYWEAQRLLQDDGGAIVAMWANYIAAHGNGVAHDEAVGANWVNDGLKVAERWWFAG
ncbi:ABC transporter substrate-binding protein [Silicimonas algicola]|uniref:Peptide/nickel transport system substrate-binding protein n=1 Tax=Silicimonas algicola TaxID=1826607 RepID=A0A316G9T7_9RHOB|nr:ABC transporter substrate-binding protein [Silicimonas algicola]AZQ67927.1 ABC transporter substrate-binding protein [Silicimonas algicola]PWK57638.1 peptide/nickel transport system substrate-binding protein [Silicimonas algicola]